MYRPGGDVQTKNCPRLGGEARLDGHWQDGPTFRHGVNISDTLSASQIRCQRLSAAPRKSDVNGGTGENKGENNESRLESVGEY